MLISAFDWLKMERTKMHGMNNITFNKFIRWKTPFYLFLLFFVLLPMSINWNDTQNIFNWKKNAHTILRFKLGTTLYTGCNRRNGPDFGRVFLRSNYTDI